VKLDQPIDRWTAATARATSATFFAHLVTAARTCIDTLSDDSVTHRVAVADQHAY
jgi:hypothetical protein